MNQLSDWEVVFEALGDAHMTETEVAVSAGLSLAATSEALDLLQNDMRVKAVMESDGLIVWSRA